MSDDSYQMSTTEAPEDKELRIRIRQAYNGEVECQKAIIPMDLIVPFSDHKPEISQEFRDNYLKRLKDEKPVPMTVYEKDGKFKVSDDYELYFLYKELGHQEVLCLIVGEYAQNKGIKPVGDPYKLQPN